LLSSQICSFILPPSLSRPTASLFSQRIVTPDISISNPKNRFAAWLLNPGVCPRPEFFLSISLNLQARYFGLLLRALGHAICFLEPSSGPLQIPLPGVMPQFVMVSRIWPFQAAPPLRKPPGVDEGKWWFSDQYRSPRPRRSTFFFSQSNGRTRLERMKPDSPHRPLLCLFFLAKQRGLKIVTQNVKKKCRLVP